MCWNGGGGESIHAFLGGYEERAQGEKIGEKKGLAGEVEDG